MVMFFLIGIIVSEDDLSSFVCVCCFQGSSPCAAHHGVVCMRICAG